MPTTEHHPDWCRRLNGATAQFQDRSRAWQAEMQIAFGAEAAAAMADERSFGEEGSALNAAYLAMEDAFRNMEAVRAQEPQSTRDWSDVLREEADMEGAKAEAAFANLFPDEEDAVRNNAALPTGFLFLAVAIEVIL